MAGIVSKILSGNDSEPILEYRHTTMKTPNKEDPNVELIESLITSKTKAIVVVHYAGMACEMDTIMEIAKKHIHKTLNKYRDHREQSREDI